MIRFNRPIRLFLATCMLAFPLLSHAKPSEWEVWLASQIQQHPEVIAAKEQWLGSSANADAVEQPLYNPELSSDVERIGEEDNYRLGIQQTIDWNDKRGIRQQQANYLRKVAHALFQQHLLNKTSEAVVALIEWRAANRAAAIAQSQVEQLNALLELVEKRQQAGDLGSIDAELTFLSLSRQLAQVAEVEAELQKSESRVRELLPQWSPERGGIPDDFWTSQPNTTTEQSLLKHPIVASAHARWQGLKEKAKATRLDAKADPTVGFNAGQDGGESMIGLTFSIPLNVRNDFSAETRAADRTTLEAEALFQAKYRKQRYDWQASLAAWQRFEQQYERWQSVVQGRIENSAKLLERQWRSGDLSTTDYLLALSQRSESLLAGIKLEKQTRLAFTEVLQQSGQLLDVTMPSKTSTN